jgi:hypothetical protein
MYDTFGTNIVCLYYNITPKKCPKGVTVECFHPKFNQILQKNNDVGNGQP